MQPPTHRPESVSALAGLALALHESAGGAISLGASEAHRIKVSAGPHVAGTCGRSRFVYAPGDIDVIPAGESESWSEDGPSRSWIVALSPRLVARAAEDMGRDPARVAVRPLHQVRDARIMAIASALHEDGTLGYPGGRLYLDSLGLALASHLLGGYSVHEPRGKGLSAAQARRLREYIDANLDRELSLARLAKVAALSPSQLKLLFKRTFGSPVHAYVMHKRVERAVQLLRARELSIAQVALDAGFAHPSHLARCMRRTLGLTPRDVRGQPYSLSRL
jgi:AraC family transcriptional regulator